MNSKPTRYFSDLLRSLAVVLPFVNDIAANHQRIVFAQQISEINERWAHIGSTRHHENLRCVCLDVIFGLVQLLDCNQSRLVDLGLRGWTPIHACKYKVILRHYILNYCIIQLKLIRGLRYLTAKKREKTTANVAKAVDQLQRNMAETDNTQPRRLSHLL